MSKTYISKTDSINLDVLPVHKNGKNKGCIDWKNTPGTKVPFSYNGMQDYFEILSFNPTNRKLEIKYKTHISFIDSSRLKNQTQPPIPSIVGDRVSGFRYDVNENLCGNKFNITILDRWYATRNGRHNNKQKQYKIQCNLCGNVFETSETMITTTRSNVKYICPFCSGRKANIGSNDITIVAPWMIKFFQGGYNEAKLYLPHSSQKIYPICPICHRVRKRKISINTIFTTKSIGCDCKGGISYPNRFMYKLLKLLGVDFICEYCPEWSNPYRYDFFIPSKNVIIEMDGGIGHGKKIIQHSKLTINETKERDVLKDKLAKEHRILVIRIDCDKSDQLYISQQINKKLSMFFVLENVNYKLCDEFAQKNIVKEICDFYEFSKPISIKEIANKFNCGTTTVCRYLHKGAELGWCHYNRDEAEQNRILKCSNSNKKRLCKNIDVFNLDGSFIRRYESATDLERKSVDDFGFKLYSDYISKVARGIMKQYHSLIFSYS